MNIPAPIMRAAGKCGKWFVKHGPKLMSVSGGVMAVGGAVMACKATLHADEVLDRHKQKMAKIEAAKAVSEESGDGGYTEQMIKRDKAIVYAETAVEFIKLYAPAVSVGFAGVGLMQGAFYISERRGAETLAALTAMNEMYNELLAKNPEIAEEMNALPVEKKEIRISKIPDVAMEGSDKVEELLCEDYIPVEMFDVIDNDPFAFRFDSSSGDSWCSGNCFVLNSNEILSTMKAFEYRRASRHVWVNDIRRAFGASEKALGDSHGYNTIPGDVVEYEAYPFVYDMIDGMCVGMSAIPGDTTEERMNNLKELELSDRPDQYCYVIQLHGNTPNGTPRFIRNEVYGK